MKKIKVLKISPLKSPKVIEVSGLEDMYKEIGCSLVQEIYPFSDPIAIICDDEGKINGQFPNRCLWDDNQNVYDIICGPFLVVGTNDDEWCDLSDEEIEKYTQRFSDPELFFRIPTGIRVLFSKGTRDPIMINFSKSE